MGIKIGIIGGSGLDNLNIFTNARDTFTGTVWGEPSSPLREGEIAGISVAVLARHGRSHTIAPSSVNYRANIQALKDAGCTHILATTATGSLREEIRRGDLVILDQFIDFTKQRKMTFHDYFKPGQPVHAPMAEPFDAGARASAIHPSRVDDPAEQGPRSDGPEGPDHPALALTQHDAGPACSRRQTGPATTSCHNVATRPKTATSPAS